MATKKNSSNKAFGGILAVVAIAGVATLGYVVSRPAKVVTLQGVTPNVAALGITKGSADAPVEVIEFADFECPGCGQFATVTEPDVMNRLVATGEVRFRFMDFPLDAHPNAVAAHNAAACANEQGKFWEMHDRIFQLQDRWNAQATKNPKKPLKAIASEVGLDAAKWEECYDSERMLPQIAANRNEGLRLRVGFTPSFVIGDQLIPGAVSYDQFRQYVTLEKVRKLAAESAATGKPARP